MRRSLPFRRLTPAEKRLVAAYPTGEWVDVRPEGDRVTRPKDASPPDDDQTTDHEEHRRAGRVREAWARLNETGRADVNADRPAGRVRETWARLSENRRAEVNGDRPARRVREAWAYVNRNGPADRERVVRAEVIRALLLGARPGLPGQVAAIRLIGARVVGDLDLAGAELTTTLHLIECQVGGVIDLVEAQTRALRLRDCDLLRLRAGRVRVDGVLDIGGCVVHDGIRLDNAHVSGQLRMSGCEIGSPAHWTLKEAGWAGNRYTGDPREQEQQHTALWAGGLVVEGGAFLRGMTVTGGLRLHGARFNGGLWLQHTEITATGRYAVHGDYLQATVVNMGSGFSAEGEISLRGARISGTLSLDGARLKSEKLAVHTRHLDVGEFLLTPESIEGGVDLGYTRVGLLADRPESYPGAVRLNGLVYESLRSPATLRDRLSWLTRHPDGYRPQPYEQLAAYYRRIGHEHDSRRVLLAKQRARRRTLTVAGRAWGVLLDAVVGYGFRPWLAAAWLSAVLTAGTVVFSLVPPVQIGLDERPRHFNPFVYTLDHLVPVSLFEQRAAWEPTGWTIWVANALIASGWILATALIAGGTRVLRPASTAP
ncbi:hypothetical protein [Herbidospora sp. NBRC 101105]|uniref:hypothetical protein n=1 Tax=Herbidospora sp. NBRC 101105 TaxID=3032195 RepID=UPI0024A2CAE7|nr:hypothetical protein [Herbidospora sp. NBRC 101105]GLX94148.1 oxidoreductase [Herbidospora sp. NBRC 101105]